LKSIIEQIHQRLDEEENEFNKIRYGKITFIIQDGKVLDRESLDRKRYDD
jgi:hypothetical protein